MVTKYNVAVSSSAFSSFSYNTKSEALSVNFHNGRTYVYSQVPSHVFDGLCSAESSGSFFQKHIKGKFPTIEI